ncbi:protein YIPF1 [Culicoides brevitarsis]|uniref:protein YIPF1 n=1 Tax=Culicoides brevitarsis TaxID=469753 RepID=UPI00307BAF32
MVSDFDDSFENDITTRASNTESSAKLAKDESASVFSLKYYQRFFDVDAKIVIERITHMMYAPKSIGSGYLETKINKNPDFYGPFWIVVTLIFAIGVSGNVADFFHHMDEHNGRAWHYNFHLLGVAASIIISYVILVPVLLWGIIQWSSKRQEVVNETDLTDDMEVGSESATLIALICVYGYSLAIYIPVSILWTIQISLFQYVIMITAAVSSGLALIAVLRPSLTSSIYGFGLTIAVGILHFLLAAGLMMYFFHGGASDVVEPTVPPKSG